MAPGFGLAVPLLFATDLALRSANNGFVLVSAALVLMMTPALALFYAGFVRSRNVLNTMVMSFTAMALVSVLWVLFGYSLAFSPGSGPLAPFIGGLQWAGLSNWSAPYGDGQLSHGAVALFQVTFAIITPALISGAVVERMHFRAWMVFLLLWSTFIYLGSGRRRCCPGGRPASQWGRGLCRPTPQRALHPVWGGPALVRLVWLQWW